MDAYRPIVPKVEGSSSASGKAIGFSGTSQQPHRQQKRVATKIACEPCRKRRSKCDGLRPTCTTCKDNGENCSYEIQVGQTRSMLQKQQLQGLKDIISSIATEQESSNFLSIALTLHHNDFRNIAQVASSLRSAEEDSRKVPNFASPPRTNNYGPPPTLFDGKENAVNRPTVSPGQEHELDTQDTPMPSNYEEAR
ncbi:hypothetical protein BT63DRAFT_217123 [Microthyrium microscopicum]|uniref:Zn(2)-C6 fungal-type domain-containing protein n=1 Tax=Microthyrium microscopicum TaxID=703497 RepID=A0A6A6UK43_9PEZI|nr:hypothetical protein BT63DRAFT_217123 [Microthyrium microscopicum]